MATSDIDRQLAELERLRTEGEISDVTFNVQRNLLITRAAQLARRRAIAARDAPPLPPLPPPPAERGRGRRLSVNRTGAWWLLGAAAVIGAVLLAYHVGTSTAPAASNLPSTTPAASSSGGTGSSPGATSAPGGSTTSLDESQPIAGGGTITLIAYADHFTPVSVINNPLPDGGFYAAVELRVCAGSQAPTTVSPFDYVLVEPDHSQASIATGPAAGIQPELQLTQVASGHCTSGWLSYGVVQRPTALADTTSSLTWPIA